LHTVDHSSVRSRLLRHTTAAAVLTTRLERTVDIMKIFITSAKEDMQSSLSVCLLATLRKNFQTDLHEIFREGWQWANEHMTKFW